MHFIFSTQLADALFVKSHLYFLRCVVQHLTIRSNTKLKQPCKHGHHEKSAT